MFSATKSMANTTYINIADNSQEIYCPIHPADTNWNKTFHPSAGRKHGSVCRCSVCAVYCVCSVLCRLAPSCAVLCRLAPSCAVLRRLAPSCAVLRRLAPSCRLPSCGMVQMVSAAKQSFSRPYLPSAPKKATETAIFFFGQIFAPAAAPAAGGSSNNNRRIQQQQQHKEQQEEATGGSRRKKQQEEYGLPIRLLRANTT